MKVSRHFPVNWIPAIHAGMTCFGIETTEQRRPKPRLAIDPTAQRRRDLPGGGLRRWWQVMGRKATYTIAALFFIPS